MLTLPEIARSRYLLNAALSDIFGPLKAVLAVEVLLGPEPDQADDEIGTPLEWSQPADQEFEPDPEDLAWLDRNPALPPICGGAPDDETDWSEYAAWSAMQDALEASSRFTDEDLAAAGLAVG